MAASLNHMKRICSVSASLVFIHALFTAPLIVECIRADGLCLIELLGQDPCHGPQEINSPDLRQETGNSNLTIAAGQTEQESASQGTSAKIIAPESSIKSQKAKSKIQYSALKVQNRKMPLSSTIKRPTAKSKSQSIKPKIQNSRPRPLHSSIKTKSPKFKVSISKSAVQRSKPKTQSSSLLRSVAAADSCLDLALDNGGCTLAFIESLPTLRISAHTLARPVNRLLPGFLAKQHAKPDFEDPPQIVFPNQPPLPIRI